MTGTSLDRRVVSWGLLVGVLAAAAAAAPLLAALVAAVALATAVVLWPGATLEVAAFAVLGVRPSLDAFSERRIGLSEFLPTPDVVFGLAILCVAAVAAIERARTGRNLWPTPALLRAHAWLFAAYGIAFVSGATLYGSAGVTTGARELVRVASIVAAFLIVAWWVEGSPVRYTRGWLYLVIGLLVPCGTAIAQWMTGYGTADTENLNRLQGTFSHPIAFGQYLVPFILVAVGGLRNARGPGWLIRLGAAVGLTVLLSLTYSRTPLLALVVGLLILPFMHSRRFGWSGLLRGLAVILVTAGLVWWLAGDIIERRFVNLSVNTAVLEATSVGISENSFTWRVINWAGLISLGLQHPLTGHGAGMTMVLNPLVSPANQVPYNAHDDFVRFFFEGGVLGLGCYLVYGLLMCRWVLMRAREGSLRRAASGYALAAAWISLFFLTGGTPELSLMTAGLYQLYAMTALTLAPESTCPASRADELLTPELASARAV